MNFAPGKIPLGVKSPESVYIPYQPMKRPTSCKVWLASDERRRCSNEAKMQNPLKLNSLACHKVDNRSQPLVSRSLPYCEDMWRRYCCLTIFSIVDTRLISCEDSARQICPMVRRGRFLAIVWVLYFQPAACSTFQTCILNSH